MMPYGSDFTCQHGEPPGECPHGREPAEAARAEQLLAAVRDGAWLDRQNFPALRYAVPGIVPEGFTLLIGPPKAGKSWLALAILLGIATGGRALGAIDVPAGRVLYLALEDGDRRMQDRCRTLMAGQPLPALFCYVTAVNPGEVLATIEAFLSRYPDTRLVVIDTLGKIMPPAMPNETHTYSRDYRIGGRIKAIADGRPGLAVTALHHDRKASSDDFVELSGTNGLAGAADTIVVLSRARQSPEGFLAVTGRDVLEAEYAIEMGSDGTWSLAGDDLAESAAIAVHRQEDKSMSDRSGEILTAVRDAGRKACARRFSSKIRRLVYEYLRRQVDAGRLTKLSRGLYVASESVRSVRNERDDYDADLLDLTPHTSHTVPGEPEPEVAR